VVEEAAIRPALPLDPEPAAPDDSRSAPVQPRERAAGSGWRPELALRVALALLPCAVLVVCLRQVLGAFPGGWAVPPSMLAELRRDAAENPARALPLEPVRVNRMVLVQVESLDREALTADTAPALTTLWQTATRALVSADRTSVCGRRPPRPPAPG
jgi:hypothetical protein